MSFETVRGARRRDIAIAWIYSVFKPSVVLKWALNKKLLAHGCIPVHTSRFPHVII
jgi:hypothetical protein